MPRSRRSVQGAPSDGNAVPAAPALEDAGYITVRVGKLPGRIETIALNGGRTVGDALCGAGLDGSGHEIKVNAAPAAVETVLHEGDTVLLVRRIRGNS